MKRFLSILLALSMCMALCVPAFAVNASSAAVQPYSSGVEPKTPSGYTYYYSRSGNASVDAAFSSAGSTIAMSGGGPVGLVASVFITRVIELFDESEIEGDYIDYVYKCNDPVSQGVPYIYWHKIKYTAHLDTNGDGIKESYPQWSSGYEYPAMPRSIKK